MLKSRSLLGPGAKPVLDLSYPTMYLVKVEVRVSGEVLTDWGLGITKSTVKGSATHTDDYSNHTKEKEKKAGVPTANI